MNNKKEGLLRTQYCCKVKYEKGLKKNIYKNRRFQMRDYLVIYTCWSSNYCDIKLGFFLSEIVLNLLPEQPHTKTILINKIQLLTNSLVQRKFFDVFVIFILHLLDLLPEYTTQNKTNLINLSNAVEILKKIKKQEKE